ncbi:MAG: c-type cytochrome, partial [Terriglobia bacterium]
ASAHAKGADMNKGSKGLILTASAIALALSFALATTLTHAQSGPAQTGAAAKTAGEAFKNIQVLKDIPADELDPTMDFIASSLGVRCTFCHVESDFSKDDKHAKVRAREMIRMQLAIDKENFNGRPEVTCYTCHRGLTHPVGVPVVGEQLASVAPGEAMSGGNTKPSAMPTADQILAKYVQALGGMDAIQKISSRVEKGTMTGFGARTSSVEISAKAPDRRALVIETPRGKMVQTYNGAEGWISMGGRPAHEVEGPALAVLRLDAQFYFPAQAKQLYGQLRMGRPAKVGDADAYVLMGIRRGQPPVQLYFDKQSGLLLRAVEYTETPLGRLPTQTDFSDYRETDGVKVPFHRVISRPGGASTLQLEQVQQNVPVDDAKFAKPAASAAPAQNPPSQ